jgi:hypothetical protein
MKIEKFNNRLIAFDFENEMVNATDILKLFPEKRMNNFLRNEHTKQFMNELERDTLISATVIKQGGVDQGTWMHRLLAFKFAAWLDPKFELFVFKVFDAARNEHIKKQDEKLINQQMQLDYFWDKDDIKSLYK